MLNSKLKRTSLALVLAVVLMLSLFPVAAYALEDAGAAAEGEDGIVLDAGLTDDATAGDATADGSADDATAGDATADDATADDATADDTSADEEHDHDHDDEEADITDESKGLTLGDIISLAVLAVVIILVVVYCLTHKEKVAKLWRGLKSEFKKIVWTPRNQVRKNTLVVLVIIVAAAILIGVLDLLFSKGILALGKIF